MDGVSFSPVFSSSLQHQASNQICSYHNPLACYGNKASHVCFSQCVFVCSTRGKDHCENTGGCSSQRISFHLLACNILN